MSLAVLFHSCEGKTLQDKSSSKKGVCWAAQWPCLRQAVITVKANRWLSIFASDPLPPCHVLNSWSDSQVPWLSLAMLRTESRSLSAEFTLQCSCFISVGSTGLCWGGRGEGAADLSFRSFIVTFSCLSGQVVWECDMIVSVSRKQILR